MNSPNRTALTVFHMGEVCDRHKRLTVSVERLMGLFSSLACELYPSGDSRGYHSSRIPWVWRIWMVQYGNIKDTTSLHPLRKQKIVQDQVSAMPLTTSWRVLRGSGLDVEWDWIITHLRSVYGACSSWRGHRKALIKHYMWQTYTNFVYFEKLFTYTLCI